MPAAGSALLERWFGASASTTQAPGVAPDNGTNAPTVTNTTMAAETAEKEGSSTVTVTVVIVILVLALLVVVGVFVYLRMRKRRMADYEKKTQIQMSSTSNAGVYVDLTSAPADKEKAADSPETEHLNKEED
ncbi:uncharacterized protein [Littorina saxatilis]|uniref:uncharacterized protein isoform X2 n=1 Tax=Littorina saxatilis TaxID=31220 RepID=UPI0038B577A4